MGGALSSCVVTIAGTNGKGTAAHALDALARAAGWTTGRYTSPHLVRYNERITLNEEEVDDGQICRAFEQVEAARGDTTLTFFEYGTLAALAIFAEAKPDLCILEVGLGGRLDATNIIDPDISILCSLALDHQDWLGNTLEEIAREKAGICRRGRPAIIADPSSALYYRAVVDEIGACAIVAGQDFATLDFSPSALPADSLNAAAEAWRRVSARFRQPVEKTIEIGLVLKRLQIPGRMSSQTQPYGERILDVAHNPASAMRLATELHKKTAMETALLVGMAADKDVEATCAILATTASRFFVCGLSGPRGAEPERLAACFPKGRSECFSTALQALGAAETWARQQVSQTERPVRIIIAGSFMTVGESGLV